MYNWSVDETVLKKDPKHHAIWKLSQMVNFGLNGEKISAHDLQTYRNSITIEDSWRRQYIDLLLYGKDERRSQRAAD